MLQTNTISRKLAKESSPVRLNLFQRLVRQWETLHPYNGVQALRVRGLLDLNHCRRAWQDSIDSLGLGRVHVAKDRYHFVCLNGDTEQHTVQLCPHGTCLYEWISTELNHPFDPAQTVPFRPFLIHQQDSSWFGLTYQHWVADSASIRRLMREWFARLFDPTAAATRPLRAGGAGYFHLFGPHRSNCSSGVAVMAYLRWHSQFRRVQRIENPQKFAQLPARFIHRKTEAGLIDRLVVLAKEAHVTVNDIFLAAIAQACRKYVPIHARGIRNDLAIGTIVDLRPKAPRPMDEVFNLLLGFTSISCRPADFDSWPKLLSAVARQTRQQKLHHTAEGSWIRMIGGLAASRWLNRHKHLELYRKRVALAGAVSNVNLNRDWPARYHPDPLLQYIRVAPTGPMTPLVFTTTTLGNTLGIGLTYRHVLIKEQWAAGILQTFVDQLEKFVEEGT
ncbi:MAG: hypothetical protein ABSF29_10350 [Tepidisphaeraceae bacterium]|jgi:hypothetical protein